MKKPSPRETEINRVTSGAHPGAVRGTASSAGAGLLFGLEGRGARLVRATVLANAVLLPTGAPRTRRSGEGTRRGRSATQLFGVSLILLTAILGVPAPASAADSATTTRESVASDGTQATGASFDPAVSSDGRYVAFKSTADDLVPGDTNGVGDVFVHNRDTGGTERVSVASDGAQGNGSSGLEQLQPAISVDGRYVAFESEATNLVPGDTNEAPDVFVHDRATGSTERVSVASDGTQASFRRLGAGFGSFSPAISADGRHIAFFSRAVNLVPGDINDGDVFVHDRATGSTERVSVASDGTQTDIFNESYTPAISSDGRYVSFESPANNLVPGDTNGTFDTFVRDRVTGSTERVSIASDGTQANGNSQRTAISADGRYVAFVSEASNIVPGDTNGTFDAFVRDRVTGSTERVSIASDGTQANGIGSFNPAISANGRYVAFGSFANNLVPGDTPFYNIFLHDRATSSTERVSVASDGTQANENSIGLDNSLRAPAISGDGRYVAFTSRASNLVPGDTNGVPDVFVRDRQHNAGAAGQLEDLETLIIAYPLKATVENSLLNKITGAQDAIAAGKTDAACSKLADFLTQVADFRTANKLTDAQATELTANGTRIRAALSC